MKSNRERAAQQRSRNIVLCLGVVVAAACSFNTDGITFTPDSEFNAGAGGRAPGAGSGPTGDAGDQGDAGDVSVAGKGGTGAAGKGGAGKGGGNPGAGAGGVIGAGGRGGAGGGVTGGAGGSTTGGMGGVVNGAGAGGAPATATYPCKGGSKPGEKLLADFENISSPDEQWKDGNGTVYGAYAFPDPAKGNPEFAVKSALFIHAKIVTAPTGGGIRMSPCLDLRGAAGIGFDLTSTYTGAIPTMVVRLVTNQSLVANDVAHEGLCVPKEGQDPHLYCEPPHVDFSLKGQDMTQIQLKFSDFGGGKPNLQPDLDQVMRIEWAFSWAPDNKPYESTFTIDNVYALY